MIKENLFLDYPNYDRIINEPLKENNNFIKEVIKNYQDLILEREPSNFLKQLDRILNIYFDDDRFQSFVGLKVEELNKSEVFYDLDIVSYFVNLYHTYEEEKLKNIKATKWL